MLGNCNYDKTKLLYKISKIAAFIDKHALKDSERDGHPLCAEEYKELTHKTVVFKLKISSKGRSAFGRKGKDNEYLLAWTTTPWTIPGNVALAVDPNIPYLRMKNDREVVYIIAPEIKDVISDEMLANKYKLYEGFEKGRKGFFKN